MRRKETSPAHAQNFRPWLALPRSSWKGQGSLGSEGILPGKTDAKDSLLMRWGRWLAEGTLSEGSRCSEIGPLWGHRGSSHPLLAAHLCPLPRPAPRQSPAIGGMESSEVRTPTHSH